MKDHAYHHGDLHAALLDAAEAEISETGIEAFSLRKVAKRAGVSHAAPAHHFGNNSGLLTALAVRGFERFVQTQQDLVDQNPDLAPLEADALGYIEFAEKYPALFKLIFSSDRPDWDSPELMEAGFKAHNRLVEGVASITGVNAYQDANQMGTVSILWAAAHGLADLLSTERLLYLTEMSEADRREKILEMLRPLIPSPPAK